jgi:hypothetical protein
MGKAFKVGRFGEPMSQEYSLPDDATVNDAIAAVGMTVAKGETLAIDGTSVKGNYVFEDGDRIFIASNATGAKTTIGVVFSNAYSNPIFFFSN